LLLRILQRPLEVGEVAWEAAGHFECLFGDGEEGGWVEWMDGAFEVSK
jgi:hypothetical protein